MREEIPLRMNGLERCPYEKKIPSSYEDRRKFRKD